MPAAARPEPEIASAMPAQPQWNSSAEITCIWPSGSAAERWMSSSPLQALLRASLMTSQGMLSSASCLAAAGRITSRAKFRQWSLNSSCSSLSAKSIWPPSGSGRLVAVPALHIDVD